MIDIKGNHPYADAWPMFGTDDLADLAEDIAANGLLDPIVVDGDGLILDGRNRYAACEKAGVDPTFTVFDGDDPLGYVLSVNGQRRHQSKGSRAASWALTMLEAEERAKGRWTYGAVDSQNSGKAEAEMRRLAGIIADHAPDLLYTVRDDELSLNAAYEAACDARDAERQKLAEQERIAADEADAKAFIESSAPDLGRLVGVGDGYPYQTYAEARAIWEQRHREEAERLRREKAEKEKKERDERRARSDLYTGIARNIEVFATYGRYPDIESVMDEYDPAELGTPRDAASFEPPTLADAKQFIDRLIEWSQQ